MSTSRLEHKVGWFVLSCLVLLGVLLVRFSKGTSLFRHTYAVKLVAVNVGGIRTHTSVLMAGVPVGNVSSIELAPEGRSVTIWLKIYTEHAIHRDAKFVIEPAGFLGDQFVAIYPTENTAPLLTNGEPVHCEEPFNLQEAMRSASGFIRRLDSTAAELHDTIARVDQTVLNGTTLSNIAVSVDNIRKVSEDAIAAVSNVQTVVDSSAVPISTAVSNVNRFSLRLNDLAGDVREVVATNSVALSNSLANLEAASASTRNLLSNLESGRGLAGTVLNDEQLAANVSLTASNLAVASSNLNRLGLWGILWSHKPPRTSTTPAEPVYPGKNPTR